MPSTKFRRSKLARTSRRLLPLVGLTLLATAIASGGGFIEPITGWRIIPLFLIVYGCGFLEAAIWNRHHSRFSVPARFATGAVACFLLAALIVVFAASIKVGLAFCGVYFAIGLYCSIRIVKEEKSAGTESKPFGENCLLALVMGTIWPLIVVSSYIEDLHRKVHWY